MERADLLRGALCHRLVALMKGKATYLISTALLVAALVSPSAGAGDGRLGLVGRTTLLAGPPRHLAETSWWGGVYSISDEERIAIYISTSYPEWGSRAGQWVDFFAGLPHGSEISFLRVYVAPLAEVSELCSSVEALGCYGGQTLVTVGDTTDGIAPASVATHEYGHHVAANRNNAPWRALDWGTKRWASKIGVCSRVQNGTAFPGDEGLNYSLNPGEAFAESYRVLAETNGTAEGYDWPIVDPSFRPTSESLAALRDDILHPWVGPTKKTIRGKFLRGKHIWSTRVATPFDGDFRVRVTAPGSGADDVKILSGDGRTLLATGSWNGSGGKSAEYRVCGARSVKVRVIRAVAAARFTLQMQVP